MALTVVLTFFAGFILMALALDAGIWYFDHRTAQNQVDAAAQAAVLELPAINTSDAEAKALLWLRKNGVTAAWLASHYTGVSADCAGMAANEARIVFGDQPSSGGEYYSVRVCLRRQTLVLMGRLSNITDAHVSAGATAKVKMWPSRYAIMAMHPTACSGLNLAGQANVQVRLDGSSYTNSSSTCPSGALTVNSNAQLVSTSGVHHVVGDARTYGVVTPPPTAPPGRVGDPFANVPVPPYPPGNTCTSIAASVQTLGPGTYCSLHRSNGQVFTLTGGVYVFKQGVTMTGTGTVLRTAAPSLIYITCASPPCNPSQSFSVAAGASINLTGLPEYQNLAIWADRNWGPGQAISTTGRGNVTINGNLYAISSTIFMSGDAGAMYELNSTIVGNLVTFSGQARYDVTWNESIAPKVPVYGLTD